MHFAKEETHLGISTQVFCSDSNSTDFPILSLNFNKVVRHTAVILTSLKAPIEDGHPLNTTLPKKTDPGKHLSGSKDFNKTRKGQIPKQTKSTHSPPWGRVFTPVC